MLNHLALTTIPTRHPAERPGTGLGAAARAVARVASRRPLVAALAALLALDAVFAIIEALVQATDYGFPGAYRLSLQTEGGLAEIYGYVKSAAVAGLVLTAWRRWRHGPAAVWAGLYLYLMFDDALRLHERFGARIASVLDISIGDSLRPQDVGELIVYLVVGLIALGALAVAEHRYPAPRTTVLTRLMLAVTAFLAFFAVGADMALQGLPMEVVFEDGGELVALSLALATAFVWTRRAEELAASI